MYPLPVPGGLGTHLTVDIGGQLKIGPNVEKVQKFDYLVNPDAQSVMVADVSKFWPDIKGRQVSPDYVGIRPKIYDSDGQQIQDFIFEQSSHEDSQVISLLGIESPGVTCCLSIANRVLDMLST